MIKVKIITPLGLYKEGEVEAVHLRTVEGDITILPNHKEHLHVSNMATIFLWLPC